VQERAGGVLSHETELAADLASLDEGVGMVAGEDLIGSGNDAGDECACDRCMRPAGKERLSKTGPCFRKGKAGHETQPEDRRDAPA
jgi:hypothetical protein